MSEKLLPCPFCGGDAAIVSPLGAGNIRAVECRNTECASTGPWGKNEAEAIAAWNTRPSMQVDAAPVATSDRQDAIEAAQDVLAGRGNGTYNEALDAIRWLLQSAGIYDAPVAMVRVTNSGYAMSLAQYVAYSLPEGDHWLYTHPPVDNHVSTSSPVDDREPENTSDKADTAPAVKSDTVLVSNKLRSAVEVWRDAYDAFTDFYCHTTEKDAAAVIEADRAALVAEICEWLDSQTEEYPAGNYAIFAKLIRDEIEEKWGGK